MKKKDKFETCTYCSRVFIPSKPKQKACPECREIFRSMSTDNGEVKKIGEYEKPSLSKNIAAAKAAGMSYGQYKAFSAFERHDK